MTSVPTATPASEPPPGATAASHATPSHGSTRFRPSAQLAPTPRVLSRPPLAVADRQRLATAVVYCEANFGDDRRQDRQRARPPLREVRHRGRDRQPQGWPRQRHRARRRAQRHPHLPRPRGGAGPRGPGAGLLHLRDRAVERDAVGPRARVSCSRPSAWAWTSSAACTSSSPMTPSSRRPVPPTASLIRDVRKPRATKDLRVFSGRISEVDCPRIAVLGTDCAIGKRTTATILTQALQRPRPQGGDGRHRARPA